MLDTIPEEHLQSKKTRFGCINLVVFGLVFFFFPPKVHVCILKYKCRVSCHKKGMESFF